MHKCLSIIFVLPTTSSYIYYAKVTLTTLTVENVGLKIDFGKHR